MDALSSHFITTPIPCAVLAVYEESQMRLQEFIRISGRANTTNNQDRLHIVISYGAKVEDRSKADEQQWDQRLPTDADWPWLQNNVPPCLICVRDWQHYTIDDVTVTSGSDAHPKEATAEKSNDSDPDSEKNDPDGNNTDTPSKQGPKEQTGSMKHLTELIKDDVEQCLLAYRQNLLDKKPVPGKLMFLILLKEGIKNPHKAVNGLKHLKPSEVAAICVTSGSEDISTKIGKLEQLVYDVGVAYYDKRISLLTKSIYKTKSSNGSDDTADINCAIANYKIGYFHEFLFHFKESIQALSQAWALLVPCATRNPSEDNITFCLYIALELIKVRFAASNLLEALTFAYEALSFFKTALHSAEHQMLYQNVVYLLQHAVAIHLDRFSEYKELHANNHIRQHAVNFYKWTIQHMLSLRSSLLRSKGNYKVPKRFATLLFKDDDDFKHLYEEGALAACSDVSVRIENLEKHTERMLVQLIDLLSKCSWYNTLFQVIEMLGDSLMLSSKPREAFFVYSNVGESLINSTALDTDSILKSCSSQVIVEEFRHSHTFRTSVKGEVSSEEEMLRLLPNFLRSATNLLVAEHMHSKGWWALYRRLLSKMMVALAAILKKLDGLPETIKNDSCLPVDAYEPNEAPVLSSGDEDSREVLREVTNREYLLILFNSFLTLRSVMGGEFDLGAAYKQLLSDSISSKNVEGALLLSKYHKGQYMLGKAEMDDNTIATRLQVLINFHVDLPFAIDVSSITICTSIGTFDFEITETVPNSNYIEIYTSCRHLGMEWNQNDPPNQQGSDLSVSPMKTIVLEGNRNVFLAMTCPPINNQFMVDNFKLLGLKLLWSKKMDDGTKVNIACMAPYLSPYLRLGLNFAEKPLFTADPVTQTFKMIEHFDRLGATTSMFKTEDMLHMTMAGHSEESSQIVDTIVELMDNSNQGTEIMESISPSVVRCDSYENGACRMFVNRIYFKVFIGTMVEGHVSPVTCVLLYNKQILSSKDLSQIKFSAEVTSTASSFLFYTLCKDQEKGSRMRQCVNNKFSFTLTDFADMNNFESELAIDTHSSSDLDTVVPALFADDEGQCGSISNEMDIFLELAKRDANVGIVYIHGLLKLLSHGVTNVQFNLQMQPMQGNTLKAVESNFLVVKDVTEAWVHEPVQLKLSMDAQYDNVTASFLRFLRIGLINKTEVKYKIEHVKITHEEKVVAENKDLLGFGQELENNQSLQFMYLCPPEVKSENSVEVECMHYVIHPAVFPFDRLQQCFRSMKTKALKIHSDHEPTEITISLKHESNVELGEPFEVTAEIKNMTSYTLDYCVTLPNMEPERVPFFISGPRLHEITAMPQEVSTLKWTLMARRCGYQKLPSVKVTQRRKVLLRKENFESIPSKVYVSPRRMLEL